MALYLDLPLTDVQGLYEGRILYAGRRHSKNVRDLSMVNKVLVVDDSVYSGAQMREVRQKLIDTQIRGQVYYGAVYITPYGSKYVDFWYEIVDIPRVFEWNVMHHSILINSCVDIDGVLCRDPSPQENDDGKKYIQFLSNVKPLIIPSKTIGWLVTCRLEKYREHTEAWLKKHGIEYQHLVMMDLLNKAARVASKNHASFKARSYEAINAEFFIESSKGQAEEIANLAGKPVLCTETGELIKPGFRDKSNKSGMGLAVGIVRNPFKNPILLVRQSPQAIWNLIWRIFAMAKKAWQISFNR